MVRSTFLFIFFLLLWSTANAQVSVTATSGTIGPTPYATLGAAFTAINAGTHTGAITVTISGNTTETASASLNASVAPASYTSVTITPSVAAIITGSVTGALIRLNGADNVTIDGRIGGAGRNLSIINTATGGSAAIQLSSTSTTTANTGAINNVIRNLEIACGADQSTGATSTFGILMNGTTISATSNGQDNNNNQFLENRIVKCRYGITTRASTSNLTTGLVISGNIIGPASFGSDEIGKVGIYLQGETGAVISNNTIQYVGGTFATTTGGADRIGIAVGVESWSNSNSTYTSNSYSITNNIIHDVVDERAFSALGILLGTTGGAGVNTDNVVANNFVFGIRANGTGGDQCVGIGVCGGKNDKVVFNSVYLTGLMDPVGTTATSMSVSGIRVGAASSTSFLDLTVKNNICYVDVTSGNAAINHYCISSHSNSFNWGVGGCDYNDYYYPASNTQMKTGGVGSTTVTSTPWTPYATLADWKAVFTPAQDANSKEVLPPFTSATDLHLIPGTATQI